MLHYRTLRGPLTLPDGSRVVGEGSVNDERLEGWLRELADVRTPTGKPQYLLLLDDAPDGEGAVIAPGAGEVVGGEALRYPDGVTAAQVDALRGVLDEAGLSLREAATRPDAELGTLPGIGEGRIRLIRRLARTNGYPHKRS